MVSLIDLLLVSALLLLAVAVLLVRDARRACQFFIVFGVVLAGSWLRLAAPELALAELVIGAGLTGVMLLRVQSRLARADIQGGGQ